MAENSAISWTDNTFNPWMGCTKVSPACKNCYAERDFDHRYQQVKWGKNGTRKVTSDSYWRKPIKWNRDAMSRRQFYEEHKHKGMEPYVRPRIFCASLADVFEDWQGPMIDNKGQRLFWTGPSSWGPTTDVFAEPVKMDDLRRLLFEVIDATPELDWLLLTKRPENIKRMWWGHTTTGFRPCYRQNVWLGTSVENQEYAEKRIPELLKCRDLTPVLFLSCEPLLDFVDLSEWIWGPDVECDKCPRDVDCPCAWQTKRELGLPSIDWVIVGSESGPERRPTHQDWIWSLRDQCRGMAGIPFFVKQLDDSGRLIQNVNHFPKELQIQELPSP